MIDFHSHILPGMDDGSPDAETSLRMLRAAVRQGVTVQLLTPHFYPWKEEETASFLRRRDRALSELRELLPETGMPLLLCAAEVAFFPGMSRAELGGLCAPGGLLLVELPFESWDNRVREELSTLSLDCGYRVLLAHVERYLGYAGNAEMLDALLELPLCLQFNAGIFEKPGPERRRALRLLKRGVPFVLGTDAHNLTGRPPDLVVGRHALESRLGAAPLREADALGRELLTGKRGAP